MLYSPIINDYSAEKNIDRATSWYEFVIDRTKFDKHIDDLANNRVQNPSGSELIKIFLKHAANEEAKRAKLLKEFCAQIVIKLDFTLEDIENHIPLKYQKQLLLEVTNLSDSEIWKTNYHRWVVRSVTRRSHIVITQDIISEEPQNETNGTINTNNISITITPALIVTAISYLEKWIDEKKKSEDAVVLCIACQAGFELGEYYFSVQDSSPARYSKAEEKLSAVKELLHSLEHKFDTALTKYSTVDEKTLDAFILASKAAQISSIHSETEQSQIAHLKDRSPVIQLEYAIAKNDTEAILLLLLEDCVAGMTKNKIELPWSLRKNLEFSMFDSIVCEKIKLCNLMKQVIQGEPYIPQLSKRAAIVDSQQEEELIKFLFLSASRLVKQFSLKSGESQQFFERLQYFLRSLCMLHDTSLHWKLFLEYGADFVQPGDEKLHEISLKKINHNELLSRKRKLMDLSNKTHQKRQLYCSTDPTQLNQLLNLSKPNEKNSSFLALKSEHLYQLGKLKESEDLLSQIPNEKSTVFLSLSTEMSKAQENGSFDNTQISVKVKELFSQNSPNVTQLEAILAFLLNNNMFEDVTICTTQLKGKLDKEKDTELEQLCDIAIQLSELNVVCSKYLTVLQGKEINNTSVDEQREMGKNIEPAFDRLLGLILPVEKKGIVKNGHVWSSSVGILSRLGFTFSLQLVEAVASLLAGALFHLKKSRKSSVADPAVDRYGPLAQLAGGANFFAKSKNVSSQTETQLLELFHNTIQRLHYLSPQDSRWVYGLGDYHFDLKFEDEVGGLQQVQRDFVRFRESIKYYLIAGAIETSFFTGQSKISKSFLTVVKRLMSALCAVKEFIPAVVLCQFLPNADYPFAFKVIQENVTSLDPTFFQFIWEVPILELLITIYSKVKDEKKLSLLLYLIGRPELNQHNAIEVKESFVQNMKMNFLKTLSKQFI